MAIVHENTTTYQAGTAATVNVTLPAAATAGRLIILCVKVNSATNPAMTMPAGFTTKIETSSTNYNKLIVAYKIAVGGDASSSIAITGASGTAKGVVVSVYSGVDTTTPLAASSVLASGTMSTTTLTVGSVTMDVANSVLYGFYGGNGLAQSATTGTMTERADFAVAAGSTSAGAAEEAIAASGATGTRSITLAVTTSAWASLAIGINPAAGTTTLTQTTFRGRNDDGNQTTATWKATAGTDWTQAVDQNFRVRFNVNATAAAPTQNTAFVLRYSLNGGAYTAVSASSSVVRASASANLADGAATTEQLAGSGAFNAGTFDEVDGSAAGFAASPATGQDTEVEYSVQIRSADVADGDTINLRLYSNAGVALNGGYTDTPIITVSEAALPVLISAAGGAGAGSAVKPQVAKLIDAATGAAPGSAAKPQVSRLLDGAAGAAPGSAAKPQSPREIAGASGAATGSAVQPQVSRLVRAASGGGAGSGSLLEIARLIDAASGVAPGSAARVSVITPALISAASGTGAGAAGRLPIARVLSGAAGAAAGSHADLELVRLLLAASGAAAEASVLLETARRLSGASGVGAGSAHSLQVSRLLEALTGAGADGTAELEVARLLWAATGAGADVAANLTGDVRISAAAGTGAGSAAAIAAARLILAASGSGAGLSASIERLASVLAASGAAADAVARLEAARLIAVATGAGAGGLADVETVVMLLPDEIRELVGLTGNLTDERLVRS